MPREQYEIRWKDYYQLLGVRADADQETIRRIYRRLIQLYHPDVAGVAVDQERIADLNEAHEVLSDPERRARYDEIYTVRGNHKTSSPGSSAYDEEYDGHESDWDGAWDSPPFPALSPDQVDLGVLDPDQRRTITFQPGNLGGPARRYHLTCYPDEPWVSAAMESDTFPCPVYVTIDPRLLRPGQSYTARLTLSLDGVATSARIRFRVADFAPREEYYDEEVEETSGSRASDQFPPLRLLESLAEKISPRADETQRVLPWLSWRWQRLALVASIPMAAFFILVSLVAAAWAVFLLALAWLAAAIYGGVATGWLRDSREAPLPARIAGGASIGISGVTYTLVLAGIVLYVLIMVLFFRVGVAMLKDWWEREMK